jgi:hypothetical protein
MIAAGSIMAVAVLISIIDNAIGGYWYGLSGLWSFAENWPFMLSELVAVLGMVLFAILAFATSNRQAAALLALPIGFVALSHWIITGWYLASLNANLEYFADWPLFSRVQVVLLLFVYPLLWALLIILWCLGARRASKGAAPALAIAAIIGGLSILMTIWQTVRYGNLVSLVDLLGLVCETAAMVAAAASIKSLRNRPEPGRPMGPPPGAPPGERSLQAWVGLGDSPPPGAPPGGGAYPPAAVPAPSYPPQAAAPDSAQQAPAQPAPDLGLTAQPDQPASGAAADWLAQPDQTGPIPDPPTQET